MTKGFIKSCFKKSVLYKKFCKNPTVENKSKYTTYRNKLKSLLNKAEKHYFNIQFKSLAGDLRKTWKLLRVALNQNKIEIFSSEFLTDSGDVITNIEEIANRFNDFFVTIGSRLAGQIPPTQVHFSNYFKYTSVDSFLFYSTDADEVVSIVNGFNDKSSCGVDGIPMDIMKKTIKPVSKIIADLVNFSFTTGHFPDELKIAKVCPIFKSGAANLFANYRPISILPSFSKVFEKIACNRLQNYLNSKDILSSCQYGFRPHHSTYMALLDMYDHISNAIDNHEVSIGVFIDLAKAFDTLNHTILLDKLERYGIRGLALEWFTNYLTNRKQYVYFNGVQSEFKNVTFGVPQGSIIGPLLFILYINDLPLSSKLLKFILFADDTNLFYSAKSIIDLIATVNAELKHVCTWFTANKLSLNISKTNYVLFGHKSNFCHNSSCQVIFNGIILSRVEFTKFLGVYIDQNLDWKQHTSQISLKLSRSLGILNRVKSLLSIDLLKSLYYTMIHPYFLYCIVVWGGASKLALNKLICLQKRAVRLITRSSFRAHCNMLFVRLGILKLTDIYKLQVGIFIFSVKNGLLPLSSSRHVQPARINHRFNLRVRFDFEHVECRTLVRERYVGIIGPKMWNVFPDIIKLASSLNGFKKKLKDYLIRFYI